jgi:hypothetical protein
MSATFETLELTLDGRLGSDSTVLQKGICLFAKIDKGKRGAIEIVCVFALGKVHFGWLEQDDILFRLDGDKGRGSKTVLEGRPGRSNLSRQVLPSARNDRLTHLHDLLSLLSVFGDTG